jgi:predicted amidohydrolase YtcJ
MIRAFQEARRQGKLPVRVRMMIAAGALRELGHHEQDIDSYALDLGIHTGFGDDRLRIGGIKVFADGSLIGRTAAMNEGFADDPGNRGFFQTEPEALREIIVRAHRSGWQVGTHAIGDRAVTTVLDIYEEALRRYPRSDHRHRIEHCGIIDDAQLARLAWLGVIPVPQGQFISEIGDGMMAALGPERTALCYRQRSFLDHGVALPGSSDRPVVNGSPLLGIHAMVNQRTAAGVPFAPRESLSPVEALRAYTLGSAYAAFDEQVKGSIERGKLADFAVLSQDITAIPSAAIAETRVLATVVGGDVVFDEMESA